MAINTLQEIRQLVINDKSLDENQTIQKIQRIIDTSHGIENPSEKTDILSKVLKRNKTEIYKQQNEFIKTGWDNFDTFMGGLHLGEFMVVGGRPGMGKTQLMTNLALQVSVDHPVLYVSLDLSEYLMSCRIIATAMKIELQSILSGHLSKEEEEKIQTGIGDLEKRKLYLYNGVIDSMHKFQEYCAEQIRANGIRVIIVDYLQLLGSNRYRFNRELEISYISRTLKSISRKFNVCVIASSQLSRSVEMRGGTKRPILSDLRESGAIEQDADKVIFIYRPEYYGLSIDEEGNTNRGSMDLIIAKNRCGPLGTLRMKTDLRFSEFLSQGYSDDVFSFGENRLNEIYSDKNENIDLF
jgi:replicative DNA helicase